MMKRSIYLLIVMAILSSLSAFSQNDKTSSQGDMEPLTIRVEKGKSDGSFPLERSI